MKLKLISFFMSTRSTTPHSYIYVLEKDYLPVKEQLVKLIKTVQQSVQGQVKFTYKFIGSSSRDMITMDQKSNVGYDFDLDLIIDANSPNYDPKKLKDFFITQFNNYVNKFGYDFCEDSTSVFTIKAKDINNSRIIHSADFGIVREFNGNKQYIKNNKAQNAYSWEIMPKYPIKLSRLVQWCRDNGHWNEVRSKYLIKKNENTDPEKKSRMILADTVNEVYQRYHK